MNLGLTRFLEQHYEKPIRFLDFPPCRTKIVADDVAERFDKLDASKSPQFSLRIQRFNATYCEGVALFAAMFA
jgi:hypothetical protein